MTTLKDIIALCGDDSGKVFVIDEAGDVKLVMMNVAEYQKLLLGRLQRQVEDIEKINREITKAQLQDEAVPSAPIASAPTVTSSGAPPRVDLRAEVIDPSFDFDAPAVQIEDL